MHANLRLLHGSAPEGVKRLTLYKWGVTVWVWRVLFSIGHDTRSRYSEKAA